MSLHAAFAIAGGLAEAIGFILVLFDARRVRRVELGEIGRVEVLWTAAKETLRNPAPAALRSLSAGATSSATADVTTPPPSETAAEALTRRVDVLEQAHERTNKRISIENDALRHGVEQLSEQVEHQVSHLVRTRKADLDRTTQNQRLGACVFLIGIALNVTASLI